jgi:hypothetical protein
LAPRKAKPGRVQALADGLVEVCSTGLKFDSAPDPHYLALVEEGFAAVPAVIDHLDDTRLTRCRGAVQASGLEDHLRVCDVANAFLLGLAGEGAEEEGFGGQEGRPIGKAAAQAWWEKASKVGEEAYLLAHILPRDNKAEWPHDHPLRVLVKKYPKDLPKLYRDVVDGRPRIQSWPLAEAVALSALPLGQKVELFLHGARTKQGWHRLAALQHLKGLAPERFLALLLDNLDGLPETPEGPQWESPAGYYAAWVVQTDDPRAWRALERAARRCDVGQRTELLAVLGYRSFGQRQRQRRVALLAAFLEDAAVMDAPSNPGKSPRPLAVFGITRLEVRDLAAWGIASVLGMPADPEPDWGPKEWAELRSRVRQAIKR